MLSPDRNTLTTKDDSMDLDIDIEHDSAHAHAHAVGHMSPSSPPSSESDSDLDVDVDVDDHGEQEAHFDFGDLGVGSEESVGLRESTSSVSNFGSGDPGAKLSPTTRRITKSGQSYGQGQGQGQKGQGQGQEQGDRKRMEAEMDRLVDKGWRWGLGEGVRAEEVEGW
ncbi:hypothetical protein YB2330_005957 [Saitoella coloradoensis]